MEKIKEIIDEFMSFNFYNSLLPFLILIAVIFGLIALDYLLIYRTNLMTKILQTHGFISDEESCKIPHFHNMDTLDGSYEIERKLPIENRDWSGKHFLFIPTGKINTLKKSFNKLTIWYNGYSSKGMDYKVKKLPKDWKEKILSKERIINYNGTFIISNMFVKTINLTSLRIDLRNKNDILITYLFDNGSERVMNMSPDDFFSDILHKDIPYNIAFLSQCEIIRLR